MIILMINLYSTTAKDALFMAHFQNHKDLKYTKVAKQNESILKI